MMLQSICPDGSIVMCQSTSSLALGTHGQGGIACSYRELLVAFGEPDEGDGYKTQAEWTLLTPAGIATIYDWKQGDNYHGSGNGIPVEEVTEWSIGGGNKDVIAWVTKAIAKNQMKLYARITSERESRTVNKGGDEFLNIELSAFGKIIGHVLMEVTDDNEEQPVQYLVKFSPSQAREDWVILKEGHKKEGVIQSIKA